MALCISKVVKIRAPPLVTDEDAAIGMVAFGTPAPRAEKRRLWAGDDAAETRPFWSQSRCAKSIIDSTDSEKRLACKVYQKLNGRIGRWEGKSGETPFRGTKNGLRRTKTARSAKLRLIF